MKLFKTFLEKINYIIKKTTNQIKEFIKGKKKQLKNPQE